MWQGNLWDFCSLNTFLCHLYLSERFVWVFAGSLGWIVMLLMKYWSWLMGHGMFFDHGTKVAFFAFSAQKIIGSWV